MASLKFSILIRQLSTSAARCKLVTAPVQVFGTEGRYAHALYSAASKEQKLEAVEKELNSFKDLLKRDPKLSDFLYNPTLRKVDKKAALQDVMTKQKSSNLTSNLFAALAENGRLTKVNQVITAYNTIMRSHRGEVICSVTTAKPLDSGHQKELKAALQGFLKKGETLQFQMEVDPTIIGGMVVSIGDKYIDMSMSSKIKKYTNVIKEAV